MSIAFAPYAGQRAIWYPKEDSNIKTIAACVDRGNDV